MVRYAVKLPNFTTFSKGAVDPTLLTRQARNDLLLVQIYVDDIIFASINTAMCNEFANQMTTMFKMSMTGQMSFFLGLQISQRPRGIFINQSKYASDIVIKYENHALVAEKEAPIEFALMANTSAESKVFDNSLCSKDYKKNTDSLNRLAQVESRLVEHREREIKYYEKIRASKDLDSLLKSQILDKNKEGFGYSAVHPLPAQLYSSPKKDLSWTGLPEFKDDTEASPSTISHKSFIKFVKANDSPSKSKIDKAEKAKKSSFKKFPTGCTKFHTADMGKKGNGSFQNNINDKGYWDSGCSRHMTGNISYLPDFEPFDEGYVSFSQGGCKITRKGTIKTDKLEFENVYFVKDLKGDNRGEFRNKEMNDFCSQKWIKREFSNASTPQQNGVAKRRNSTLIEAARTITPAIGFLKPFGCHVKILNTVDNLGKFKEKGDEDDCNTDVPESSGISNPTATSTNPPADQLETLNVETPIPTVSSLVLTTCFTDSPKPSNEFNGVEGDVSYMETTIIASPTPTFRIHKDHPKSQIIGPVNTLIQTRKKSKEISDALQDPSWVEAMQEELLQFKIQNVWTLVDCPKGVRPIGTKWVLKNKKDERGIVIKNKARLENPWGKDETGKDVDLHLYRSMIGSLMYLTASRPDIMFAVCACARHQVTPKECHLHAVKRIFRYLKGHPKLGLWYLKESLFDLVAYSDSDYGGATQDRKSTTGGCQFLGRRLISWQCKKQTIVATLTTEAEYVAAASCCGQVLWIQNQLLDYRLSMPCKALSREISSSILCLRNLKLQDEEGISSLLDTELFENLTLMGYNISPNQKFTFQKGFNEFSSNIATALVCLATNMTYNFSKMIFDGMVKNVNYKRDVSQGEACPTDSGFEADQDRANIAKTSTLPHESAPRVTSHTAAEGSMQQTLNELTAFCTSLQRQHSELISKFEAQELEINRLKVRVKLLEDKEGLFGERSGDDALIKGRNLDEGEATTERVSDDTEEMAPVLTSMDAATVLASRVDDVPTGSGSIPIASYLAAEVPTGSDVVPTTSPVFATATVVTPYKRRKGKKIMVESETPKKKKVQEQIDTQVARDLEEQLAREDQRMYEQAQQRKPWTKKQKRDYYMAVIKSNLGWKVKDFRGMTFEEIEGKFTTVWKQLEDFIPMGSKEEAERLKRKGLSLEQESVKKLKTSKEVLEEAKSPDEVPKEKVKEMMQLVPIEEVPPNSNKEMELWVELKSLYEPNDADQLWTHTQNLMHAPFEWRLYDTCGVHHVKPKIKKYSCLWRRTTLLEKFEDQSLHVLGPSSLCVQAQLVDDMPFHKQACTEYTQLVFCKLFGRPKERHLACPTRMHGSRLLSFQGNVVNYGLIRPHDHLFRDNTG
nr:hypothetical protein [Tanacetum cinerariifolium]